MAMALSAKALSAGGMKIESNIFKSMASNATVTCERRNSYHPAWRLGYQEKQRKMAKMAACVRKRSAEIAFRTGMRNGDGWHPLWPQQPARRRGG